MRGPVPGDGRARARAPRVRASGGCGRAWRRASSGPAFALYAAFVLAPALAAFVWAFTRWDGIGARTWAGLYNFKSLLFESDSLWSALGNNLFLMVVPTLVVVPVSLLFAMLIHRGVWGAGAFRMILLFPNLLGGIAAALIWLTAYQPHGGLVNAGLVGLGNVLHSGWLRSFADYPWLSEEHLYQPSSRSTSGWPAGSTWSSIWPPWRGSTPSFTRPPRWTAPRPGGSSSTVTLPLIREVLADLGGVPRHRRAERVRDGVAAHLAGPSASVGTLGTLLVTTMFKDFDIGRAAALAVILFALVLVGCAAVLRALRSEPLES